MFNLNLIFPYILITFFQQLGSGTGLCGLVAMKIGAKSVIFTDNDPKCGQLLSENSKMNEMPPINFKLLDWNYPLLWNFSEPFDWILASDCLFDKNGKLTHKYIEISI